MDFPADLNQLGNMLDFVKKSIASKTLKKELIYRIELTVEEVVVNIISYGYPDKKGHEKLTLDVELIEDKAIEITVSDTGEGYNPLEAVIDPGIEKPIEERKIGGLGVFLLRKLVDELSYRRDEDRNILKMCFRY